MLQLIICKSCIVRECWSWKKVFIKGMILRFIALNQIAILFIMIGIG